MIDCKLIDKMYGPGYYLLVNCGREAKQFLNSKAYLTKSIFCESINGVDFSLFEKNSLRYDFIVFGHVVDINNVDITLLLENIKLVACENVKVTFFFDSAICQETKDNCLQLASKIGFLEDYSFSSDFEKNVTEFSVLNIISEPQVANTTLPNLFSDIELFKKIKFGDCVKSYIRQNERLAIVGFEPYIAEQILISQTSVKRYDLYADILSFYHSHFNDEGTSSLTINDHPHKVYDCIVIYSSFTEGQDEIFSRIENILTPGGRLIFIHPSMDNTFLNPLVFDTEAVYGCYEDFTAWLSIDIEAKTSNNNNVLNFDYFILCTMKNPFINFEKFEYEEISYNYSYPPDNLLAFQRDYINPWVVKSMVEFPFRNKRPSTLKKYAQYILENYDEFSADCGAALAILGYQYMGSEEEIYEHHILRKISIYCKGISSLLKPSAHQIRWLVSLYVLSAELNKKNGRFEVALNMYENATTVDIENFSPTIGTKILQAYYNISIMLYSKKDFANAELNVVSGLVKGYELLSVSPEELYGDIRKPLQFTLYIYHDILDWLIKLTNARNFLGEKSSLLVSFNNATWSSLLNERLITIQNMDLMIKQRDEAITAQAQLIDERWESMNTMENLIKERDNYIHELESIITELQSTNKLSNDRQ